MIKAEELRIGNFVNYFSESADTWLDNHQVTANDILCLTDGTVDHADPIPITEEWLVRFDWNGYKQFCFNSYFSIDTKGCLWYCGDFTGIVIKYVHQLQNLFHALTQTELTPSDGGKIE